MKIHAALVTLALVLPTACDQAGSDGFDGRDFAVADDDGSADADAAPQEDPASADAPADASAPCEPHEARLITSSGSNAGLVSISPTAEGLQIDVETNGRWRLRTVEAFAGELPPNDGEALDPAQFPFVRDLDLARSHALTISYDEVEGGACGEPVVVSVHADVAQVRGDTVEQEQTAWIESADGLDPAWGGEVEATLCCD